MQNDNENAASKKASLPETDTALQSEEQTVVKKSSPKKKSSATAKKSPAKKSTTEKGKTTSKTAATKSSASRNKSSSSKKVIEENKEETNAPSPKESNEATLVTENEEIKEPDVAENTAAALEQASLSLESDEITNPLSNSDESLNGELIVPESAVFTTLDVDGEELSLIPEEIDENKDGLLNIEHFSDYTPKTEHADEPEFSYAISENYEENITILSEEEDEPQPKIVKKEKYVNPDSEKYDAKKPRKIDARFDFVELFVFTLLAVILLTTFIFRHAVVDGPSMQNTLQHGEHLIISDLFYTPEKGDIIVCQDRATGHYEPIVKRVIATEGDTIKILNSVVYVNGERLVEDYVFIDGPDSYADFPEVTVPENMLFVMGDHRNNSGDSRGFLTTFVREDAVLGKVIIRFYPFDKFGKVD